MTREEQLAVVLNSLPAETRESVLSRMKPHRVANLRKHLKRLTDAPSSSDDRERILRRFEAFFQREHKPVVQFPRLAYHQEPEMGDPNQPSTDSGLPKSKVKPASPEAGAAKVKLRQDTSKAKPEAQPAAVKKPKEAPPPPEPVPAEDDPELIEALRAQDLGRLIRALEGEQPRTLSIILSCLEARAAGQLLKQLPPANRANAFQGLGAAWKTNTDMKCRVIRTVLNKVNALQDNPMELSQKDDSIVYKTMAEMLRTQDAEPRAEMLTALNTQDAEAAEKIKDLLYVFEDLLRMTEQSIHKILLEVDVKTLGMALKGADAAIRDTVLNNVSKRVRESLYEEMELIGTVAPKDMEKAQKTILDIVRRLDQNGQLTMKQLGA